MGGGYPFTRCIYLQLFLSGAGFTPEAVTLGAVTLVAVLPGSGHPGAVSSWFVSVAVSPRR